MKQRLPTFVFLSCLQGFTNNINLDGMAIIFCERQAPNILLVNCQMAENRLKL